MSAIAKRSEIAEQFKWDIASVFADDRAWNRAMRQVRSTIPTLGRFEGHLADGPATLADWFEESEAVLAELGKVMLYASCAQSVDTADQAAAAMLSQAGALAAEYEATVGFSEPEMLAIGMKTLRQWCDSEPRLEIYRHAFDALARLEPHVRSAEIEQLLGQVSDAFGSASRTHGILADADLELGLADSSADGAATQPITQGTIDALITSSDRLTRRTAWERYADAHLSFKNSMANAMATGIKQDVFEARARHYASALEASVLPNFVPTDVFHNVIATFGANLPIWHRYWRVRRRALGYEQLHPYDLKAPLTAHSPKVPYEHAVAWICEGLAPLGEEYVEQVKRGATRQRWVDVYANENKASGAFSTGVYGTRPFVLMSYTDDLFSLSTLAHELGHSMHSLLTWSSQPFIYGDYAIFVAEVASNFHQALVREHLLRTHDDVDFRIAVIEEAMANFYRYFFLMPTLARFELAVHEWEEEGEGLSAEIMIDLLADLFEEGYGGEVALDRQRVGITWAQFHTHLYDSFYVYQYTTGIAGAHALAHRVLTGEPRAVEDYLAFLRAGSSLYPLDALQRAGVDLTRPEPIQVAFDNMSDMIDELALLLGVSAD